MSNELHVVALSGGKDSTAMALRLAQVEPRDYTYVCTPTGDELPEMFKHWRHLGEILGKRIMPIMCDTLNGLIDKQQALPNWRQRWCTRILKIEPFAAWLLSMCEQYDRVVSYVGLRADEPEREGGDYRDIPGIEMRFPLREWGWRIRHVWVFLEKLGIEIPERTDCARCFFQKLIEWYLLYRDYPEIYADAEEQERRYGHTFRSPGRDSWPASLEGLRKEFEKGRIPRNAEQGELFKNMQCRVCRI